MPRKSRPRWPALPKREYGSGSLSRDATTGEIRARLPKSVSPTRRSRLFGPEDASAASAWLDSEISGDDGTVVAVAVLTLSDWAGMWHETYIVPVRPPTTARVYLYALKRLEPLFFRELDSIRPSDIQAVVGQCSAKLTPQVVHATVGVWRQCFEAAVNDELIRRNPVLQVRLPPITKTATAQRRHITPDEMAVLWPAIRGRRFEAFYALMLGCGLRAGEILGLAWEDVDLNAGRAWIHRQFTEGYWRDAPKARNPHWVPLPAAVVDALRRHRARQPASHALVLQSDYGRSRKRDRDGTPWPWSRATVAADLAQLLAETGIDHATPHSGRHGLASYWLDNGVSPAVVAERLGHANPSVTLQFYTHASPDGRARADDLTAQLLADTGQNGASGPDPAPLSTENVHLTTDHIESEKGDL